jgi:hypothetical protein
VPGYCDAFLLVDNYIRLVINLYFLYFVVWRRVESGEWRVETIVYVYLHFFVHLPDAPTAGTWRLETGDWRPFLAPAPLLLRAFFLFFNIPLVLRGGILLDIDI